MEMETDSESSPLYGRFRNRMLLGHRFEVLCESLVSEGYVCREVGKWWGRRGDEEGDVDVVAFVQSGGNRCCILAECRLRSSPAGFPV